MKLNMAEFRFSGGKLHISTMISSLLVIGKVTIVNNKKHVIFVTMIRKLTIDTTNMVRWMPRDTWCLHQKTNFRGRISLRKLHWPCSSCQVNFFIRPRNDLYLTLSVPSDVSLFRFRLPNSSEIFVFFQDFSLNFCVQFDIIIIIFVYFSSNNCY